MPNEKMIEAFRLFATTDPTDDESAACSEFITALGIADTDSAGCIVAAGFYAGWLAREDADGAPSK